MKIEREDARYASRTVSVCGWQLNDFGKPEFTFNALSIADEHAVRRVRGSVYSLAEVEAAEVRDFVKNL